MKSAEPIKVLAIDDDPDICFYIQEILERNNCAVTVTERGREALRLLMNESFDVVMADVRLPDLDGVSILEHVRLSGSEVPFVLITGFSENEPIISSMRLGAVDYLTKPFTPSDLEKSLRRALDRKKRQDWSRHLYQICENPDHDLQQKIQNILVLTHDMLGLDAGCVVRKAGDSHTLSFNSAHNEAQQRIINAAYDEHLKDALVHIETRREPSYGESQDFFWAALPLRMHQKVQGAICFFKNGAPPLLGQDTMRSVLQLTELSISRLLEAEDNALMIANQQNLLMASHNLSSLGALASSIVQQVESHLKQISGRTVTVEKLLQTAAPEEARRIQGELQLIGSDVKGIDRIMKSVRSMTQPAAEPRQLISIRAVLDEALELVRCKIHDRPLRVSVGDVPADLQIEGDASQILQVFLILLNNSFDATLGLEHEWIQIESQLKGDSFCLTINDSGRALNAPSQVAVLQPLTRSIETTADTGLGLARQYMEAHQGSLNLLPQNSNTRFVLEFKPLRKASGA